MKKTLDYVLKNFVSTYYQPKNEYTDLLFKRAYIELCNDGFEVNLITIDEYIELMEDEKALKDEKKLYYVYEDLDYNMYYAALYDYFYFKLKSKILSHYIIEELIKYLDVQDKHLTNVFKEEKDKRLYEVLYNLYINDNSEDYDELINTKIKIKDIRDAIKPFIRMDPYTVAFYLYFKMKISLKIDLKKFSKEDYLKINSFEEKIMENIGKQAVVIDQGKASSAEGYYSIKDNKIYLNKSKRKIHILIHEFIHFVQYNYFDAKNKNELEVELPAILGSYIILSKYHPAYSKNRFTTAYLFKIIKYHGFENISFEELKKIAYDNMSVIEKTIELLEVDKTLI